MNMWVRSFFLLLPVVHLCFGARIPDIFPVLVRCVLFLDREPFLLSIGDTDSIERPQTLDITRGLQRCRAADWPDSDDIATRCLLTKGTVNNPAKTRRLRDQPTAERQFVVQMKDFVHLLHSDEDHKV